MNSCTFQQADEMINWIKNLLMQYGIRIIETNGSERILSDYYNDFRLYLRLHKIGYKFYVVIRRCKEHGINDKLNKEAPVAYFKDCSHEEAQIKGIEHFLYMIS